MSQIDPMVVPELLRPMWARRRPAILERIMAVEATLRQSGDVDVASGLAEAHKLSGLLGTLGFPEGSQIAALAEDLLIEDDPTHPGWEQIADRLADFRRSLPAATSSTAQPAPLTSTAEASPPSMRSTGVAKVLLVDDEDDVRTVAGVSLQRVGGMDTIVAASGAQGIELARSEHPDIIVLDVMMPEMDGLETLRRLRQDPQTRSIPVIFMTARAQPHEIEAYLTAGAIGVIVKPFDPMGLPARVRDIVAEAHLPDSQNPFQ